MYGFQEGGRSDDSSEGFAYPLKVSKETQDQHVDLLFMSNDKSSHYCLIKYFSRFASSQCSKSNNKTYLCRFCLHGISRNITKADKSQYLRSKEEIKRKLREHEEHCSHFLRNALNLL